MIDLLVTTIKNIHDPILLSDKASQMCSRDSESEVFGIGDFDFNNLCIARRHDPGDIKLDLYCLF